MPEETQEPIEVRSSATYAQTETLIGQIVQAGGGVLLSYGAIDQEKWAAVSGLLTILACAAWRVWRTQRTHAKLAFMADKLPNRIAKLK